MSQASDIVLFVVLVGVASVAVWWLGYRQDRRGERALKAIREREHKKAA